MLVTGYLTTEEKKGPTMHHNKHTRWTSEEENTLIEFFGGKYGWTVREAAFRLRRSYGGTRYHIRAMGLECSGEDWRVEPECQVALWRMGQEEQAA